MTKIILPTDFSENAQNAIDYAMLLFKNEPCTFYLLNAYHKAEPGGENKADIQQNLKGLAKLAQIKNDNPKHRFKTIFETDTVLNLVNRAVIDHAADYVFMGTKGSTALRGVFMGTNTVEIIKHLVACPIVAVPENYNGSLLQEILFSTDFKHRFIAPELTSLIAISKLWNATVSVVHVQVEKKLEEDQEQNKEALKNNLKAVRSRFKEVGMKNSIASTLYHLEQKNPKIGMLVLLNTKYGFFKKLLREPVLRNMAFKTEVPLLVLPQIGV